MIIYFLQVSLAWLAFLLLYYIGLRHERLFVANRVYLLGTFSLSLLLPWLSQPLAPVLPPIGGSEIAFWLDQVVINGAADEVALTSPAISWLWYLYGLGCVIHLLRLLLGLRQIQVLIQRSVFRQESGIYIGETPDIKSTFSWGPYLFLAPGLSQDQEAYRAIVAHEKAHIRQLHSFDLLLLQIVGIFFWWNPLWYAYRHMLATLHEYLADAAAIQQLSRRAYGRLLLLQNTSLGKAPQLTHAFYTSQIKSRIMMLKKEKIGRYAIWKYLSVLPLLAIVLFACHAVEDPDATEMQKSIADYEYVEQIDTIITFDPNNYSETVQIVKNKAYKEADMMPLFGSCPGLKGEQLRECSDKNMLEFIYQSIEYPKTASILGLEGMIVARLVIDEKGQVIESSIAKSDIKGDKAESTLSTEEAEQVRIGQKAIEEQVIRTVRKMPDWQAGTIDGQPVRIQLMLPVRFRLK